MVIGVKNKKAERLIGVMFVMVSRADMKVINKEFQEFIIKRSGEYNLNQIKFFFHKFFDAIIYGSELCKAKEILKKIKNQSIRIDEEKVCLKVIKVGVK